MLYNEARAVSFSVSGKKKMIDLQFVTGKFVTKMPQS